jgi:hypothetical protein
MAGAGCWGKGENKVNEHMLHARFLVLLLALSALGPASGGVFACARGQRAARVAKPADGRAAVTLHCRPEALTLSLRGGGRGVLGGIRKEARMLGKAHKAGWIHTMVKTVEARAESKQIKALRMVLFHFLIFSLCSSSTSSFYLAIAPFLVLFLPLYFFVDTHKHANIHKHIHIHLHIRIDIHSHTRTRTRTHTHTHTHTHTKMVYVYVML